MDSREVVESFFMSWEAQDVELAVSHYHDDIVYELHSETTELPYTGITRGKAATRDVLYSIIKDFDYLKYQATIHSVEDDIVRTQVAFQYQHRRSGQILEGTRRLVFQVKDGLIVRMDRFHDERLVDGFMRLTRQYDAAHAATRLSDLVSGRTPAHSSGEES